MELVSIAQKTYWNHYYLPRVWGLRLRPMWAANQFRHDGCIDLAKDKVSQGGGAASYRTG